MAGAGSRAAWTDHLTTPALPAPAHAVCPSSPPDHTPWTEPWWRAFTPVCNDAASWVIHIRCAVLFQVVLCPAVLCCVLCCAVLCCIASHHVVSCCALFTIFTGSFATLTRPHAPVLHAPVLRRQCSGVTPACTYRPGCQCANHPSLQIRRGHPCTPPYAGW